MEEATLFLQKVSGLFLEYGAKTLTMDDVAKEFGMSKKTLYQKYKNKEALLEAVLDFKLNEVLRRYQNAELPNEDAIAQMFCKDCEMEHAVASNESMLIRQLIKYYPVIFNKHMHNFSNKFSEIILKNIEKGRLQGLYRNDFSAENYARIYFQILLSYDSSPFVDVAAIGRKSYHLEALFFFLNAITTEKGKEVLQKFKP